MSSLKSPGRDIAALVKCINDLKKEKNVKSRMTHYESLTQFVIKGNLKDEALEQLHSVAVPITLGDISQGSDSLILNALGFLGGYLQVIKLPLEKQITVIEALTEKLKNVQDKNQSRKLMWSLANIQFDETLAESSLSAMLSAACLFLKEKPPVFSLSTVCESLNTLRNIGARHRPFTENNLSMIFSAVVPWLFNDADRIRELSIGCLEPFSTEIARRKILDANFQAQLRTKYYGVLNQLVAAETAESLKIWSFLIQGFGTELHESVALLNELLKIEESALKSKNPAFRQRALEHWKYIIDCFALNPAVLNNSKRIKLVLVPLKSTDTRTSDFSKTKIELWWYLLSKLGSNATHRFQEVTLPLLNFCFGSQTDKTQVRGTALVFANIVPLACSVLAGILSSKAEFECTPVDNSKLSRIHLFVSTEDFGKSIDTFSQFSVVALNLKTAIDPPEIHEAIIKAFIERCCIGSHQEALDTFIYTVMTMAVEKPANMDVIFQAMSGAFEFPTAIEFALKHIEGLVLWYAENEPLPSHPAVRFLNKLLEAGVLWDPQKCTTSFMDIVEDLNRKHGPVSSSSHPVVELWNKIAVVLSVKQEMINLSQADVRVLQIPQNWSAVSLNDKLLVPWFTLCSAWAKIDSSVIPAVINHRHLEEKNDIDERSFRATLRALQSDLGEHSISMTSWLKQWVESWIMKAKKKENRTLCTDSLVSLLIIIAEETDSLEGAELLCNEVRDAFQEHSGTKEISDILQATFSASSKAENILKLRNQIKITKIFSCFTTKNTPARNKQKPKHLDDFVVVPPQEKTKRVLTDHQKEVLRSKRRTSNVPAMYNDLSQSSLQSDSLLETQSNDGHSNIVIVSTCSLVEKEEEALLEPPRPIKSCESLDLEKTSKNGSASSIENIVKSDLKLRSKVSIQVPKLDPKPSTRKSTRLSSVDSTNSASVESDISSPVKKLLDAYKMPGPASRKAQIAVNLEKAKADAENKIEFEKKIEQISGHVDKENACTSSLLKSSASFSNASPVRRVTLQPVIELQNETPDSIVIPSSATKESIEELREITSDDTEKTVLSSIDMDVEAEETSVLTAKMDVLTSNEETDANVSTMEITTMSPKPSSESNEERSSEGNAPISMEITLCAESKSIEPEQVVNNLDALNETTQPETHSQKTAQVFPMKNLMKSYGVKKKVPLKLVGPAPCSSKRGAQMLELSRKMTRNEPPSKKMKKSDSSPNDDGTSEVLVTPEGSPAKTVKWIPRTYSPYASPSTGILKKRQQQGDEGDDGCDSPLSSAAKARRVSFADPEVSHSVKISPAKKRLSRTRTRRSLISTYANANNDAESETVPRQDLSTVMEASCNMSLSETCAIENEPLAATSQTVVADTSMDVSCMEEEPIEENSINKTESCDSASEPELHAQPIESLYSSMIDCTDDVSLIYDLFGESNCSKLKELLLKKEVKTVGDFCNLQLSCFDTLDQPDVETIKKALDEYFGRKFIAKSSLISETDDVELETPLPIKSSEESKSSDDMRISDSYPNGQIIKGDTMEVPTTQSESSESNKSSDVSPIELGDSENTEELPSSPVSDFAADLQAKVNATPRESSKDLMGLGPDEVISMIDNHPKKEEIILSLLRRHISFSFMLNGKLFPVQE